MRARVIQSASDTFSLQLGEHLGRCLEPGDVLALWGELGAGKTLLTRGIARGLEISPQTPITSPTFTLINEYFGRLPLYHLDLYRIADPEELDTLPLAEVLYGDGVAIVEWPDRLAEHLPPARWDIHLVITGENSRRLTFTAHGESLQERLERCLEQFCRSAPAC